MKMQFLGKNAVSCQPFPLGFSLGISMRITDFQEMFTLGKHHVFMSVYRLWLNFQIPQCHPQPFSNHSKNPIIFLLFLIFIVLIREAHSCVLTLRRLLVKLCWL